MSSIFLVLWLTQAQKQDPAERKHLRRHRQLILILVMDSLEPTPMPTRSTKTTGDWISPVPTRMLMRSAKDLALMDSAAAQRMHKLSHSKVADRSDRSERLQPMRHRRGSPLGLVACPDRHLLLAVKPMICRGAKTYRYRTRKEFQLGRMVCRRTPGDMQ
ncbi:uncharacterized protein LOC134209309 [Armigeres subalbatus]|uniref:uncharacterized protein LOC134209309 n=1 Tax=Armigeres subalbatus TaxID=124917 RepID=UPI002ED09B0F